MDDDSIYTDICFEFTQWEETYTKEVKTQIEQIQQNSKVLPLLLVDNNYK